MNNNKLLMIISIVVIGGLFFGYAISTFTGFVTSEVIKAPSGSLADRIAVLENLRGVVSDRTVSIDQRVSSLESTAGVVPDRTVSIDQRVSSLESTAGVVSSGRLTQTEYDVNLISKIIGIKSDTKAPIFDSDTILSQMSKGLGSCDYLGIRDLKALGIKVDGEKISLSAQNVCKQLKYNSCFAGEYANSQIYLDSTDGICMGNTQVLGKDLFLEECDLGPIAETCKVSSKAAAEPYLGDYKDNRYLVAAICCGKSTASTSNRQS